MIDVPGALFIGAASLLLGILIVDLWWDARAVLEHPFTMDTSEAIREYYRNNLVSMAKQAPYLFLPMPASFLLVVGSLGYKLYHGLSTGSTATVTSAGVSIALTFPLIGLMLASTLPTLSKIEAEHGSLTLAERHVLQRRIFRQHVLYFTLTLAAVAAQIVL